MNGNATICLRALEPVDLELLYTIENDPSLWDVTTPSGPYSRHALRRYIRAQADGSDFYASGQLRLVAEVGGEAVGIVDLFNASHPDRRAEVGIALLTNARGKGYGVQSLAALMNYAYGRLGLHCLYAKVQENNKASMNLMIRSGFRQLCSLPDWHRTVSGSYEPLVLFQHILRD